VKEKHSSLLKNIRNNEGKRLLGLRNKSVDVIANSLTQNMDTTGLRTNQFQASSNISIHNQTTGKKPPKRNSQQAIENQQDVDIYNTLNQLKVEEMTKDYRKKCPPVVDHPAGAMYVRSKKNVMVRITAYN
jgi:hypothetical protein